MRTDTDTGKGGYSPKQILEIATNVKLRDEFNLKDGDAIEVEVAQGKIIKI